MRIVVALLALFGLVVLVGATLAPGQPTVRDVYLRSICPGLDMVSTAFCAPIRAAEPERL